MPFFLSIYLPVQIKGVLLFYIWVFLVCLGIEMGYHRYCILGFCFIFQVSLDNELHTVGLRLLLNDWDLVWFLLMVSKWWESIHILMLGEPCGLDWVFDWNWKTVFGLASTELKKMGTILLFLCEISKHDVIYIRVLY